MSLRDSLIALIPAEKREEADGLFDKLDETMSGYDKDIKAMKAKLREKEGANPEEIARLEQELDAEKQARQKAEAELKKASKELDGERTARTELEGHVNKSLAETEVRRELAALKLSGDKLEELVEGYIPRVMVKAEKGVRAAYIGEKAVKDYFTEWAASPRGKAFIEAPVSQGSGATGGDGTVSSKQMSRSAFDALTPAARMKFSKDGGKLTD